jgi:hypothetical protein
MGNDSSETLQVNVQLTRRPSECDPTEVDALRAWAKKNIEAHVGIQGKLPQIGRYFRTDAEEFGTLEGLVEMGKEDAVAIFWHQLGNREGIVTYLREGELNLPSEQGGRRRTACILQALSREEWWLATRPFGTDRVGVGQLHEEWTERSGKGREDLPEELHDWFFSDRAEFKSVEEETFQPLTEGSDIRTAFLAPIPGKIGDAMQFALGIGRSMDNEVLSQGLTCHLVFAATEESLERWEIRGQLPCTLDDLIRNIVVRSSPNAVALITPGIFGTSQGNKRAVFAHAECADSAKRARRVLVLEFDASGQAKPAQELGQVRELEDADRWFGTAPDVELELSALGFDDGGLGGAPIGEA